MTLMEMLNRIFGAKLSEELPDGTTVQLGETLPPAVTKDEGVKVVKDSTPKTDPETSEKPKVTEVKETEKKEQEMKAFAEGWFNSETGTLDESKISNPEMLAAVKTVVNSFKAGQDKLVISSAISTELKKYKLATTENTALKLLDSSAIKVVDGKVTGVKEAIDALKKAEPGIFKKSATPVDEGFDPTKQKTTAPTNTSFAELGRLESETLDA